MSYISPLSDLLRFSSELCYSGLALFLPLFELKCLWQQLLGYIGSWLQLSIGVNLSNSFASECQGLPVSH